MRHWGAPEYRGDAELRRAARIAALPFRRKVACWWSANWGPTLVVMSMIAVTVGSVLWLS